LTGEVAELFGELGVQTYAGLCVRREPDPDRLRELRDSHRSVSRKRCRARRRLRLVAERPELRCQHCGREFARRRTKQGRQRSYCSDACVKAAR
jgi:hypothetical protein